LGLLCLRGTMAIHAMQIPKGEIVETADQRIVMSMISWDAFQRMLEIRGERSRPRMVYLDGALELMTTSKDHEDIKKTIAMLLEAFMLETGMTFNGYGEWTMQKPEEETAIEADECYAIGSDQTRQWPDLAIEVVWTHGGLDKLEAYRRIGVREVWYWINGVIEVHVLGAKRYRRQATSKVVPGIDLVELASFLETRPHSAAVRAYTKALRARLGT
jgi:Uma2 family endonuclease